MKSLATDPLPTDIDSVLCFLNKHPIETLVPGGPQLPGTIETPLSVLLVGPMPPPFGGTTVSFDELARDLSAVPALYIHKCLNTEADAGIGKMTAFRRLIRLMVRIIGAIGSVDLIFFNASNRRAMLMGAWLSILTWLSGKKLIVRVFGGELHRAFETGGFLFRLSASVVFKRNLILLQTRELTSFFRDRFGGSEIVWYPTNRSVVPRDRTAVASDKELNRPLRCVFASEIKPEKGIETAIAAFSRLAGSGVTLDMFGKPGSAYEIEWRGVSARLPDNIRYFGCLDSTELRRRLPEYDLLILPTRWHNEGYPGIIIEAFAAGLAVLVSPTGPIPEIVDTSCGMLIDAHDPDAWVHAILQLSKEPERLSGMKSAAAERARAFDSRFWNRWYLPLILRDWMDRVG